jgi:hypothetical protein
LTGGNGPGAGGDSSGVPVDDLLRLALINHAMAFGLDYAQAAAVVDRAVEAHPGASALALAEQVRDVIYALPYPG